MNLTVENKLKLYYFLRLTRACDDAILRLYKQGKMVGGAYTGNGNEATAVGSAFALEDAGLSLSDASRSWSATW